MRGFPISDATPPVWTGPLPSAVDVTVIGGGVVGVCTALFLRRKGLRVLLVEKGRVAGEQSSRNWGWIRQQGRDPDELPLVIEAQDHWRAFAGQTNRDIGLRRVGVTYLARTERDLARYGDWLPHAEQHGLDTVLYDRAGLARHMPEFAGRFAGALTTPSDMKAEPWVAVPALAEIAAREGVVLREGCAARTLDMAAGRIAGVVTEGGRVACPRVVLAGGAWSSLFLRAHGVSIPQLSVRSTVAATTDCTLPHAGAAAGGGIAFRPRADGGLSLAPGSFHELFLGPDALRAAPAFRTQLAADPFGTRILPAAPKGYPDAWTTPRRWTGDDITPFERMRILNPAPNLRRARRALTGLQAMFPDHAPRGLRTVWAGMIDVMPDVVPILDNVPELPGLTLGTGLSGHGFGIGPGVGRVLADLVTGDAPGHDLTRFRFGRFTDGSPIVLGPGL